MISIASGFIVGGTKRKTCRTRKPLSRNGFGHGFAVLKSHRAPAAARTHIGHQRRPGLDRLPFRAVCGCRFRSSGQQAHLADRSLQIFSKSSHLPLLCCSSRTCNRVGACDSSVSCRNLLRLCICPSMYLYIYTHTFYYVIRYCSIVLYYLYSIHDGESLHIAVHEHVCNSRKHVQHVLRYTCTVYDFMHR